MKHQLFPTIYLFDNVFFPNTVIPLSLSDEPTINLIRECFTNGLHVCLYLSHPLSKGVGTLGRILSLEETRDGKVKAMIQGVRRTQMIELYQDSPFPVYATTEFNDRPSISRFDSDRLESILKDWLRRHISDSQERAAFMKDMDTPEKLVDYVSLFLIRDVEIKQLLLECASLNERAKMLNSLLIGEHPEMEDALISHAIKDYEYLDRPPKAANLN